MASDVPDKKYLYGEFQKNENWQNKLLRKLSFKSLDIADDDVDVNVDKSQTGIGWRELAVIGAIGLGGLHFWGQQPTSPPVSPAASPADSNYVVRFYDKDGNPIDVPNISQKPN